MTTAETRLRLLSTAAAAVLAGGCAAAPARLLIADPPRAIAAVAAVPRITAGETIKAGEVQRAGASSLSVVQIRDRETPHVHTRYDLTVTLVAGEGTLWLNGTPLAMHGGDVAFVPKGTAHYFVNGGTDPAVAVVTFAPPFSGPDQAPVP